MEQDKSEPTEPIINKANDSFGEHNIMSRLAMFAFIFVFIYSFVKPLAIDYATISSWLVFGAFLTVSVGINSLKVIGSIITKIKGIK